MKAKRKPKRKPTVTVPIEALKDSDKVKILEPEIAYLRLKLNQYRFAGQQCKEALRTVTEAMKSSNEWPQTHPNCDGEPVTGGHIFRAVMCALETLAKAERGELKLEREMLQRAELMGYQ